MTPCPRVLAASPAARANATPKTAAASDNSPAAPVYPHIDPVTGTAQMLLAHASLRDPKVANPDSPENRQILQTMVTKALARAENKQ